MIAGDEHVYSVKEAKVVSAEMHAHNTFDAPELVKEEVFTAYKKVCRWDKNHASAMQCGGTAPAIMQNGQDHMEESERYCRKCELAKNNTGAVWRNIFCGTLHSLRRKNRPKM